MTAFVLEPTEAECLERRISEQSLMEQEMEKDIVENEGSRSCGKAGRRPTSPVQMMFGGLTPDAGAVLESSNSSRTGKTTSSLATLLSWLKQEREDKRNIRLDDVISLDCDVINSPRGNDVLSLQQNDAIAQNHVMRMTLPQFDHSLVNIENADSEMFEIKPEIPGTAPGEVQNLMAEAENDDPVIRIKLEPQPDGYDDPSHVIRALQTSTSSDIEDEEDPTIGSSSSTGPQCQNCDKRFPNEKALEFHSMLLKLYGTCLNCDECGATFNSRLTLDTHVETHAGSVDYFCRVCNKQLHFRTATEMVKHLKSHGVRPFLCPICNKGWSTRFQLFRHMEVHSGLKRFACDQCPSSFRNAYTRVNHIKRVHTGEKPYKCELCDAAFSTSTDRQGHVNALHERSPQRPFKCPICTIHCRTERGVAKHKSKVHKITDEIEFVLNECEICAERFDNEDEKVRHLKREHPEEFMKLSKDGDVEEKKLVCSLCRESFESVVQLKRHIKRSHCAKVKCSCSHCGKEFDSRSGLKSHEQWSHVDEPTLCSICGEEFSSPAKLRVHVRLKHRQTEDHLCSYCGASLKTSASLTVHERTHTGEKPFTCDICQKSFISKVRVRDHKRDTHNKGRAGAQTTGCPVCGRAVRRDGLKAHLTTHGDERNFKCPYCELRFKTRTCMRKHTSLHTGEKPHMCGECGKSFRLPDYLKTHMELHANKREKAHKCPNCDNRYMFSAGVRTHRKLTGCGGENAKRRGTTEPAESFHDSTDSLSEFGEPRESTTREPKLVTVTEMSDGAEKSGSLFKSVPSESRGYDVVMK